MKIQHGRVSLELHERQTADGESLLLLHELGGDSGDWSDGWSGWPGSVYALDFAGHGASGQVRGGGYYPEYFLADADLALERIGDRVVIAGSGIGAYVALLLAGARADRVSAALLLPGRGLSGGGAEPAPDPAPYESAEEWWRRVDEDARRYAPGTDPMASACEHDIRPAGYAAQFASAAKRLLFADAAERDGATPVWWRAAREATPGEIVPADLAAALTCLRPLRERIV